MKLKHIVFGIVGLSLVVGVVLTARWFTTAGSTTISVSPVQDNTDVLGSETSLTSWQTARFTTVRPTWLRPVATTENGSSASYVLRASKDRNAQIAITLAPLGTNSLRETPAVRVRLNNPSEYSAGSIAGAPAGALIFRHVGMYETGVFWQEGGMSVAVVASGSSDQQADLEAALSAMLANWQWER